MNCKALGHVSGALEVETGWAADPAGHPVPRSAAGTTLTASGSGARRLVAAAFNVSSIRLPDHCPVS